MATLNIAVYDLKQAEQIGGKFLKSTARTMDVRKVGIEYAENHNKRYEQTGSYYEINKELNDDFIKLALEKNPKLEIGGSKSVSKMNVEELKGYLTDNDVEYSDDAKKADLVELANGVEA